MMVIFSLLQFDRTMMDNTPLLVMTTCARLSLAEQLASALLTQHLAACVNVLPAMTSFYSWQGELCQDQEHQLLIKTTQAQYGAVEQLITTLHDYDEPEVIALPITAGSAGYLSWLKEYCQ